jgi:acetyl/propionyl-CoA carboxylase alpha subunit
VYEGFTVSTEYDPMLGKLISWGEDRAEAIARLRRGLEEYSVTGIKTNAELLLGILRDPEFLGGEIYTRWLDERLPRLLSAMQTRKRDAIAEDAAILAALLHSLDGKDAAAAANGGAAGAESRWKREARFEQVDRSE